MPNFQLEKDYFEQIDSVLPDIEKMGGFSFNDGLITITTDLWVIARDQLMIDGYLISKPHERHTYVLTGQGREFIRKGGYKAKFEEEAKLKQLNKDQLQSVIDTNKSVAETNTAIQDNIPVQNRQAAFSIGVGVISALFIAITVYQTCTDTTAKELKGIKEELQKLQTEQKVLKSNPEQKPDTAQISKGKEQTNK